MTSLASGHRGPVTAECQVCCLASVISLVALNRLLDSDDAAQTVGDVVRLYQEGKLACDISGTWGPRRRSEIEAGLLLAGFDISHRVRDGEAGQTQRLPARHGTAAPRGTRQASTRRPVSRYLPRSACPSRHCRPGQRRPGCVRGPGYRSTRKRCAGSRRPWTGCEQTVEACRRTRRSCRRAGWRAGTVGRRGQRLLPGSGSGQGAVRARPGRLRQRQSVVQAEATGAVDRVTAARTAQVRPRPRAVSPCPGVAARASSRGCRACQSGDTRSVPSRLARLRRPAGAGVAQSVLVHTRPRSVSPSDRHRRSDAPPTSVCRSW